MFVFNKILMRLNLGADNFSLESVLFTNEDKYVICGGVEKLIYIFDTKTSQLRVKIPLKDKVYTMVKSRTKPYLVYIGTMSGFVKCLDSRSNGEEILNEKMAGSVITSVYLSANDKFLYTGSLDKHFNSIQMGDLELE